MDEYSNEYYRQENINDYLIEDDAIPELIQRCREELAMRGQNNLSLIEQNYLLQSAKKVARHINACIRAIFSNQASEKYSYLNPTHETLHDWLEEMYGLPFVIRNDGTYRLFGGKQNERDELYRIRHDAHLMISGTKSEPS